MKRFLVLIAIAALALAACGGKQEQANSGAGSDGLKDGTYFATYSATDSHGWQPFMQIKVEKGKITSATFDYVSADGKTLKTKDAGYAERMGKVTGGMTPEKASTEIDKRMVAAQSAGFDAVSGATSSSGWAKELAAKLVDAAKKGETGDIVLPMHETYVAEDKPDEHGGWIGHLEVTFGESGNISKVSYDELTKKDGKVTAKKSEDTDYAKRFSEKSGFTQNVAYKKLEDALMAKDSLTTVDAVSGATGTSDRFNALVEQIKSQRVTVSPQTIKGLI
ncbi:FMN-binding protein [Salinispira pacifica]